MRRAIVVCVVALGFCVPAGAATLTVDLNGGAAYTDIQSAIDAAADGDTVLVKPGEYVITEPIDFNRLHNPYDPASLCGRPDCPGGRSCSSGRVRIRV